MISGTLLIKDIVTQVLEYVIINHYYLCYAKRAGMEVKMRYIPAIAFAIILIIIAFFLKRDKGLCLLAGFNTMSVDERNRYDMKKISGFVSEMLVGMALCLFAFDFGWYINNRIIIVFPWIIFGGIAIFTLVYLNSDKFKKQ